MEAREQILTRMYVVLTLLCVFPLLIAFQMFRLHLEEGDELRQRGVRQASSFEKIPAYRGTILDHSGRILAVNIGRYDLALDPTTAGFSAVSTTFHNRLGRLTGRPAAFFQGRVNGRISTQYVLLERNLSAQQVEEIRSWDVPGVILAPRFARRYTYGRAAGHLLGHVNSDLEGISGVELRYDQYLSGRDGRRAVKVDRLRNVKAFVGGAVVEPEHGQNIRLTIDLIRQTIMEEELARGVEETGSIWGTAIAMDPHTGAILGMANVPNYDPNTPAAFSEGARRNRAVTDRLEPGSTFKLVTAVAAIEQGLIHPADSIDTGQGWAVFRGRTMRDVHAHGKVPFSEVIARSSNVGTARTAVQLEPGVLYQYARNLGFGQATWVDLPGEVAGSLKKPSDWSGITQPWMSIGYEVEATPLQILTAYCALANGGLLVQPYVVAERMDMAGRTLWTARQDSIRRAFRTVTAEILLPIFEEAVESGTGIHARIDGLRVAGKTGTAQKAVGGSYDRGSHRASFVGMFPIEEPTVAIIVILDEPRTSMYGGAVAAPIFQRIAERWSGTFPNVVKLRAPVEELPAPDVRAVPDLRGMPASVALATLRARGFDPRPPRRFAEFDVVTEQNPAPDTELLPGARIRMTFGPPDSLPVMPDLRGSSPRQATAWLASKGIDVEIRGSGAVIRQLPEAGSPLEQRAVLTCE